MDFLTFKSFISIEVLILFYYLGALILPVAVWLLLIFLIRKYQLMTIVYKNIKERLWQSLSIKQKMQIIAFFLVLFLFMELFWRMLFEFLIAYLQIRDALLGIHI